MRSSGSSYQTILVSSQLLKGAIGCHNHMGHGLNKQIVMYILSRVPLSAKTLLM